MLDGASPNTAMTCFLVFHLPASPAGLFPRFRAFPHKTETGMQPWPEIDVAAAKKHQRLKQKLDKNQKLTQWQANWAGTQPAKTSMSLGYTRRSHVPDVCSLSKAAFPTSGIGIAKILFSFVKYVRINVQRRTSRDCQPKKFHHSSEEVMSLFYFNE